MIEIDPLIDEAIGGSFSPAVEMQAWRDGVLTYPTPASGFRRIDVVSWETTEDATTSARILRATVVTQDPALVPRSMDAILGPYGSEVALFSGVDFGPELGSRLVPEGRFRIDSATPREHYEHYRETNRWAFHGVVIDLTATDRMKVISKGRFESKTTASVGSTAYQAIQGLCDGYVPTGEHLVPDAPIGQITFDTDDRVAAIDQVAARINARARFNRDGQLVLMPRTDGTGSWTVPEWTLVNVDRSFDDGDFYNAVIARGRDDEQNEFQSRYVETSGPGRYRDGYRIPYFFGSSLLTTQAATDAAARTTYQNVVAKRRSVATIDVPYNPAIEAFDEITFEQGGIAYTGQAKTIVRSNGPTMRVGVWLSLEDSWRLDG